MSGVSHTKRISERIRPYILVGDLYDDARVALDELVALAGEAERLRDRVAVLENALVNSCENGAHLLAAVSEETPDV